MSCVTRAVPCISSPQDYSKALEQFQLAADKGSAEGQYYLGYMHLCKLSSDLPAVGGHGMLLERHAAAMRGQKYSLCSGILESVAWIFINYLLSFPYLEF